MSCVSPASFLVPEHECLPGWIEHAPFAFWLMEQLRPACVVELGVGEGDSLWTFCHAIKLLELPSRIVGVDHFAGDTFVAYFGNTGDECFHDVTKYTNEHYQGFAHILRMSFAEATREFPDDSVDLLHIDGGHSAEDVARDFLDWLPKLTEHAIVLFHDTRFGRPAEVGSFFETVSAGRSHFEFFHANGLGVLAARDSCPDSLLPLFSADRDDADRIRRFYSALGQTLWDRAGWSTEHLQIKANYITHELSRIIHHGV